MANQPTSPSTYSTPLGNKAPYLKGLGLTTRFPLKGIFPTDLRSPNRAFSIRARSPTTKGTTGLPGLLEISKRNLGGFPNHSLKTNMGTPKKLRMDSWNLNAEEI